MCPGRSSPKLHFTPSLHSNCLNVTFIPAFHPRFTSNSITFSRVVIPPFSVIVFRVTRIFLCTPLYRSSRLQYRSRNMGGSTTGSLSSLTSGPEVGFGFLSLEDAFGFLSLSRKDKPLSLRVTIRDWSHLMEAWRKSCVPKKRLKISNGSGSLEAGW